MEPRQDKDSAAPAANPPAKKPYDAPTLVKWGTLRDMTQAGGLHGRKDGARGHLHRTR